MKVTQRKLAANRANLAKAGPVTAQGRERVRQAALRDRPWEHATGPRSPQGKARSRMNGLKHGRYTAEKRAWRRNALKAIRLTLKLRARASGVLPEREAEDMAAELDRLAARLSPSHCDPG